MRFRNLVAIISKNDQQDRAAAFLSWSVENAPQDQKVGVQTHYNRLYENRLNDIGGKGWELFKIAEDGAHFFRRKEM